MRYTNCVAVRGCILAMAIVAVTASAFGQTAAGVGAVPAQTSPPAGPARRLTVDEAVRLALEQNLNIQVTRLNPQIQDLNIAQAYTAWTPSFSASLNNNSSNSPVNSFLSGASDKVTQDRFSTNLTTSQLFRWGGSYSFSWDSNRFSTNNSFSSPNPSIGANLNFNYTHPLLRNRVIDGARQQLMVSQINREVSDIDVRQTVVTTVRSVKTAYWDLSYAISSLAVNQQSLDLARESLRNTRSRVEIGTMAPIDIVEAQAEVATREEAVIVGEAAVEQAHDRLRALILDPATPDFWNVKLELAETATFQATPIDIAAAVTTALDKRTDLVSTRKSLSATDVNIRYFQNQTLPDVNAQVTYGLSGQGGTQLQFGPGGFPPPVIGQQSAGYGSVLQKLLRNDFPTWSVSLSVGYPIGASSADANLARAKLQHGQAQLQLRSQELQVTTQVRDAGRQVNTNLKRVEATRVSRELAERRLESEQKKFSAGLSTSFLVFQAQRDLAQARNAELRAILDYNTSLVDFETVQEAPTTGGGTIQIATGGGGAAAAAPAGGGQAAAAAAAGGGGNGGGFR
jgi:outer membrane protein TolC